VLTTLRAILAAGLVVAVFGAAVAKLPPPPPLTDAQKAEKAAKDKAAADAAKAELTRAEDKAVANYMANMKAKGVTVNPQLPPGGQPATQGGAPAPTQAAAPASTQGAPSGDSGGGKNLPSQPEKASNAHSPAQK